MHNEHGNFEWNKQQKRINFMHWKQGARKRFVLYKQVNNFTLFHHSNKKNIYFIIYNQQDAALSSLLFTA